LIETSLDSGEYLAFDISTDNGVTWTERARLSGDVGPEAVWQARKINVSNAKSLRIRFRGRMSDAVEDAHIDGVTITSLP
jgi:hypothetical protein